MLATCLSRQDISIGLPQPSMNGITLDIKYMPFIEMTVFKFLLKQTTNYFFLLTTNGELIIGANQQ